jgi:hypothetical protein
MDYYKREIENLGVIESHEYPLKIQIASEDGKTKWLNLNADSAPEIIALCVRVLKMRKGE